jgi:hypothetical protein
MHVAKRNVAYANQSPLHLPLICYISILTNWLLNFFNATKWNLGHAYWSKPLIYKAQNIYPPHCSHVCYIYISLRFVTWNNEKISWDSIHVKVIGRLHYMVIHFQHCGLNMNILMCKIGVMVAWVEMEHYKRGMINLGAFFVLGATFGITNV